MPKITFRADAELVERVEDLDASKSEVMRRALRAYLDGGEAGDAGAATRKTERGTIDALVEARIDERLDARLDERRASDAGGRGDDVTVNVNVNEARANRDGERGGGAEAGVDATESVPDAPSDAPVCSQCGESLDDGHAFCPNCGERAARHPTCECGAELRSDWAFCPDCGRRTVSADVFDR
ncbi:zinc ribbon domain-containing protein [Halarchaeum sp. CBA1220]|uniref:zinc-ribbon domain-containing protein n=1 Tax=Halarchaeum sp. CBA1220 TaxID=1853682 RepID=UPI000F3A9500|nr:zinc-ribbon domain-containing protein [Halarchaeum sp. CBA1220]QLC33700.1 zinc ribbon domain-containing protein [Halarchaeum sp. CBA1220]